MGSMVVACGALFGIRFVKYFLFIIFFLNLCMSCRMWGSIWGRICPILFIYFLNLWWAVAFSIFFFLIILVLLNWGLTKLRPFKLLFFFNFFLIFNF
jgi:hypothetical protein